MHSVPEAPPARLRVAPARRLGVLAACALALLAPAAPALNPARSLSQYDIDCFGTDAGLPHSSVPYLAQDQDGYLLATTLRGAVRFDGVRMRPLSPAGGPDLSLRAADRILVSSDGAVWLGMMEGGLMRIDAGGVRVWDRSSGLDSQTITHIVEVEPGLLWVSTPTTLYALSLADPRPRALDEGYPTALRAYLRTPDGTQWFGTQEGLYRRRPDAALERMDGTLGLVDPWIWTLHLDPEGSLWIGSRGGLLRWREGQARSFGPESGFRFPATRSILTDRDGQLWVATAGGGLHRWRDGRFESLDSLSGLASDIAWSLLEDRSGNLWVGTTGGVCRLRDTTFVNYTRRDGLGSEFVWTVAADAEGGVWAGSNGGGLDHIVDGRVQSQGAPGPGRASIIHSLLPETDGGVLLGTRAGLYRYRSGRFLRIDPRWNQVTLALIKDADDRVVIGSELGLALLKAGKVQLLPMPGPDTHNRVQHLSPARDGGVYAATQNRLFHLRGGNLRLLPLGLQEVRGVYEDESGTLWIGSLGLYRYGQGRLTQYGLADGFQDGIVHSVRADAHGYLWMTTNTGLWRAALAELDAHATNPAKAVHFERYAEAHGMRSSESNGGSPNLAIRGDQLWLATMGGVSSVDIGRLADAQPAIAARIEALSLDGQLQPSTRWMALGPELSRLDLDYTTLDLRAPEAAQFRYRLLPLDRDWQPAGSRRSVHYQQLAPGRYRFEVQATLDPDHYGGTPAAIEFQVQPHWYQTLAVRITLALALLGLALGLPLARIRRLRAQEQRLQAEVALRTADLQEANRKLDLASRTDALTGLANRREFNDRLIAASALPSTESLSLALIDVDHFKGYNDRYGHLAGDDCLQQIAAALQAALPAPDYLVARYGGEEFAVLAPGLTPTQVCNALRRAMDAVEGLAIPHASSAAAAVVTISIGLADVPGGSPIQALISAADRALYSAKHLGRNRLELAQPSHR